MGSKSIQRYPLDTIKDAIGKLEEGATLSSIAKEIGVPKTTVKYWLDNASKYVEGETGLVTKSNRVKNQINDYSWKLLFKIIKKINEGMTDASFRDLVYAARELQAILNQIKISTAGSNGNGATTLLEVSEQTSVTFKKYLEKRQEQKNGNGKEGVEIDLATPPPEHRPPHPITAEQLESDQEKNEENRTNG
jgi:transposase-like protein